MPVQSKVPVAVFASLLLALANLPLLAQINLSGRVVDEDDAPVRDARVTITSSAPAAPASLETVTDSAGHFAVTVPDPGSYLVTIEREGYYAVRDRPVQVEAGREVTLVINRVREVFQSVDVKDAPSPMDLTQTGNSEHLTGTEVNNIPYSNSHSLRSSLPLMPGVVLDQGGALHVNGASENQVHYLLNGFDITNPVSGQFQTIFAVEGIHSVDLATGRFSPQDGKGSAGTLAITTESGTDKLHYTATDFIPAVSLQQGLRFGNWYPRVGVSGPIVRGRAWFSDTFASEYTESLVTGLPSGQDTRSGWAGANLLHAQFNLNPSNILYADFLVNVSDQGRVGLGPLNPVSTTFTLNSHEYFESLKDQVIVGRGALLEFGYAHNRFWSHQTPQGQGLYVVSTLGQSGNYFVNAAQTSSRDEGFIHASLSQIHWAGLHQIDAGANADYRREDANFHRTGYQVLGLAGELLSETLFQTPALFHVGDTQMSSYLRDSWRVSKGFQFDLGIRQDWDQRNSGVAWSPRLAFSWSPFSSEKTRVSGGYAITHDAVTLDVLGRPLDQTALTTEYNPDGTAAGPASPTTFAIGNAHLVLPRAANWTLNVDHQVSKNLYLSAKYLRRRGTDGFAFINTLAPNLPPSLLPLPGGALGGVYQLTNLRRDNYDSFQFSVRQRLSGQYEWMVSYTRSRAISNAVLDPNTPQPLQILPGLVPMPWDAPNRLLAWGYLPLPWKDWAVSTIADMRSGFPFSVRDPTGVVAGGVDSYRYPWNFDLNIAVERMITLRGYRFALRGGMNNVTDRANSTAVNNVAGAPQFLQFLGNEGRHFVVRIRFFGRVGTT